MHSNYTWTGSYEGKMGKAGKHLYYVRGKSLLLQRLLKDKSDEDVVDADITK